MLEKLVLKLQTPESESMPALSMGELGNAVKVATQIEKGIFDANKHDLKGRQDKFRSMMSVFIKHAHMRTKLLSGQIEPAQILTMKREDFLSEESRETLRKAEEARKQEKRTDWARAQDRKAGYKDSFFKCKKCGSKKTSYYQQQTRGADEPMTNFIECLDCMYTWKE